MNDNKTRKNYHLIAGILFAAAFAVQYLLSPLIHGYFPSFDFWTIVFIIGLLGTAVLMILNRRDLLTVIAIALITIIVVRNFICYFDTEQYNNILVYRHYSYYYYSSRDVRISYFLVFVELLRPLAYLLLLFIAAANFTDFLGNAKDKLNGLWFLPCALMVVYCIMTQLRSVVTEIFDLRCVGVYSFVSFVIYLVYAAAFLLAGLWITKSNGFSKSETRYGTEYGNTSARTEALPEAYFDLVNHTLLLVFTFGIWMLIWVYRMTGYTNAVKGEEKRNPTNKLLLYIFVPLYSIYWIYKTAQRIDKMAKEKNIEPDIGTPCLILAVFVPVLAPILMQDKMNKVVSTKSVRVSACGESEPEFDPKEEFKAVIKDAVMRHCHNRYSEVKMVNTTVTKVDVDGDTYTGKGKVVITDDYGDKYEGNVIAVYEFDEETQEFTQISLSVGDGEKGTLHKKS